MTSETTGSSVVRQQLEKRTMCQVGKPIEIIDVRTASPPCASAQGNGAAHGAAGDRGKIPVSETISGCHSANSALAVRLWLGRNATEIEDEP